MLHGPLEKKIGEYYCWIGILLAGVAVMLVEICVAKGILAPRPVAQNTEGTAATAAIVAPRAVGANPAIPANTAIPIDSATRGIVAYESPH